MNKQHTHYNTHTHIFNFDCVPDGFLSNYVRSRILVNALAWTMRSPFLSSIAKRILNGLGHKYATFLTVGTKKTPLEVFEEMLNSYQGEQIKFTVLPMNFDYMGVKGAPANYITQIKLVLDVRAQYPDICIPFLAIDPRMGTAQQILDFIKDKIEPPKSQFVGIKLYPSLGFYPTDPRLESAYEWCEANNIPITTHCTREGVFYAGKTLHSRLLRYVTFNPTKTVAMRHMQQQYIHPSTDPSIACDNFLEPVNYIDILEKYPRLKLCFAHFGGDSEMEIAFPKNTSTKVNQPPQTDSDANSGFAENTSRTRIIDYLMKKYRNVYTDISFTLYKKPLHPAILSLINDTELNGKILFGTDYYMATRFITESKMYNDFREYLSQSSASEWEDISVVNPRQFLTSSFYTA